LTFSMTYAFSENFLLPLSHDEVVYGKRSILGRMPGDEWQRFANLRLLYSYMFTHPGGKLLFMGCEFGQINEWNFRASLDWHLMESKFHQGVQNLITDLNVLYQSEPAMYEQQFSGEGFEWIAYDDHKNSVLVYIRKGVDPNNDVLVACNMTPTPMVKYGIGVPKKGKLQEIFNSDDKVYNGTGDFKNKVIITKKSELHNRDHSAEIIIPPLGMVAFKYIKPSKSSKKISDKSAVKSKAKPVKKSAVKTSKTKPKSEGSNVKIENKETDISKVKTRMSEKKPEAKTSKKPTKKSKKILTQTTSKSPKSKSIPKKTDQKG